MAPDSAHVFYIVSSIFDVIFLLISPIRLWKLRGSAFKNPLSWQGLCKAALGVLLAAILTLRWIELSGLVVQQKAGYLGALCLSLLLLQEQRLSDRASDPTTLYLLASTLCDVIILAAPSSISRHVHTSRTIFSRSGKSTLLSTLLRLLELESGNIELDGVDIKTVKLDLLRQRCFIAVSQDPLLLPNETLRFNLDPDGLVTDGALIDALTETGLWARFFEGNRLLDEEGATIIDISEDSDIHPILHRKLSLSQDLSVGQCQLFALCRALVKSRFLRSAGLKPVILLDEVTSSLDADTEATVYQIVGSEFTKNGHTVIIVAHRLVALETYMESGRDAVALIADGRLHEVI
ncbi:hypothetical protein EYB25_001573 [Talaromyces marneffei]|nr:hypothetical protein EYB25_001573 [Talaromyces marneffei]